jgi:syntaxin-binding protein 1
MSSGLDNPCILAYAFQNELDRFCQINNIPTKDPSERATLLILDRSCDFYAPILHDFTYQAMINDLIHLADGITYRYLSQIVLLNIYNLLI